MTYADRCKLATDCLPAAEHRRRLETLHGEMLAEIEGLHAELRDLTIERDILRRDNDNHVAERLRLRAALDVAGGALHRWVPGSSEDDEQAAAAHHRQVGLDAVRAALGE